jgi:hypothetical protein
MATADNSDWRSSLAQGCDVPLETADRAALTAIAELIAPSIRLMELEETNRR